MWQPSHHGGLANDRLHLDLDSSCGIGIARILLSRYELRLVSASLKLANFMDANSTLLKMAGLHGGKLFHAYVNLLLTPDMRTLSRTERKRNGTRCSLSCVIERANINGVHWDGHCVRFQLDL